MTLPIPLIQQPPTLDAADVPHPLSQRFLGPINSFRRADLNSIARMDERRLAGAPFRAPMAGATPEYMAAMTQIQDAQNNAPKSIPGQLMHLPMLLRAASSFLGLPQYRPTGGPRAAWEPSFKGIGATPAFGRAEAQEQFRLQQPSMQAAGNPLAASLPMLMQMMQGR